MCLMFWNDNFLEFDTLTLDSNISKARIFIEVPAGKFTSRHNRGSIKLYFSGLTFRQRSSVQYIEQSRWGNIFGWVWSLRKHRTEKQQYCSSSTNEMIFYKKQRLFKSFYIFQITQNITKMILIGIDYTRSDLLLIILLTIVYWPGECIWIDEEVLLWKRKL